MKHLYVVVHSKSRGITKVIKYTFYELLLDVMRAEMNGKHPQLFLRDRNENNRAFRDCTVLSFIYTQLKL